VASIRYHATKKLAFIGFLLNAPSLRAISLVTAAIAFLYRCDRPANQPEVA
jgi:hypothetical protein